MSPSNSMNGSFEMHQYTRWPCQSGGGGGTEGKCRGDGGTEGQCRGDCGGEAGSFWTEWERAYQRARHVMVPNGRSQEQDVIRYTDPGSTKSA